MSLFITFEGIDGSGKTTQARALQKRLAKLGHSVLLTQEPGGTSLGKRLRHLLKGGSPLSPQAELFLFAAARAEHVSLVIEPALDRGVIVICDRFTDSTIVYQGHGRGLSMELIQQANSGATRGIAPTLTFLLDLPVEEALRRKGSVHGDRFEREGIDFHRRLREGYLALAKQEPERIVILDGLSPKQDIAESLWTRVMRDLSPARPRSP